MKQIKEVLFKPQSSQVTWKLTEWESFTPGSASDGGFISQNIQKINKTDNPSQDGPWVLTGILTRMNK